MRGGGQSDPVAVPGRRLVRQRKTGSGRLPRRKCQTLTVVPYRDREAFYERAADYETGWLGAMLHEIADRTVRLARAETREPEHVLDVGCGTGYLLRRLASRCPGAGELVGVDPAAAMITTAQSAADDERLTFSVATAEQLPFPDGAFDLVVSTTSFDHWSDQRAGLVECARVMKPDARLVLVDQFSLWLSPTLIAGRRGKARTKTRANALLSATGFRSIVWHDLYSVIIKAVTASR
jgi:SAM-dependent methyltransferase